MSIYQQPPLEGPRQLGSPWGPERERKKWSSRFNKRKLLIGVGVYLLLNLAYFLLSILTPYSFVPELRLLIWVLFSLFCLGFGLFLVIGLGLLIIKFVRQEPKRKILYALLGLLAYLPFAGAVLTAMLVFGNKRKLLIGVGVYLLLNLAYFLLSILTPYSFVPELRLLIWVLFSLFCLGFGLFLVIGLGLLIIKFVRQEPKRKILYALLGLLAYLPFAGAVLTAMLVFGVVAFVITLVESDWEAHPEYGTVYYERVSDGTILNKGSYCRSMEQVWGPITRKGAEDALCKYRGERADTYSDPGYLPEAYPSETDLPEEPTDASQAEDGVTWTKE